VGRSGIRPYQVVGGVEYLDKTGSTEKAKNPKVKGDLCYFNNVMLFKLPSSQILNHA
jgi:hypothetical protein